MSLLDERGTGAISWQRNLAVLWCGVFFACASYTMVVPFLPVYLLQELHVESSEVNFWSCLFGNFFRRFDYGPVLGGKS